MKRMYKIINKLLHVHIILIFLLTIISIISLSTVFTTSMQNTFIAYLVYFISAYTLIILIIGLPKVIYISKDLMHHNKYINRYINEVIFRAHVSLYLGLLINSLFATFNMVLGIYYNSIWFGALSIYYVILSLIRLFILTNVRNTSIQVNNQLTHEWFKYRFCGFLLIILNSTMIGIIIQMIRQNHGYEYPGMIIYAASAFTFYYLTVAIINILKFRKLNSPILTASKMISFTGALLSILSLQTAMLTQFCENNDQFRQLMNALMGGGICTIIFFMAIYMILRGNKEVKKIHFNNSLI